MFKFNLKGYVAIRISCERGHIKARAEYANGENQYLIHYLGADGRARDAWFEEGDLSDLDNSFQYFPPPTAPVSDGAEIH